MASSHFPRAHDEPAPVPVAVPRPEAGPGVHPEWKRQPLIDQQVLRDLGGEFDSPTVADDFARDFAQSWEGKYQRLAASVHLRNQEHATEAALSVKVTSIMVGAFQLARLATHVEELVVSNDMDAAARALPCVEDCGSETRTELLRTFIR